ncbi:hypothetical protein QOT17_014430 [Balamuthia mandrillaris]
MTNTGNGGGGKRSDERPAEEKSKGTEQAADHQKQDLQDVLAGHYLAKIVWWLHRNGVFERLSSSHQQLGQDDQDEEEELGHSAEELASALGYDQNVFSGLLQFVAARTDILQAITLPTNDGVRYRLHPKYAHYPALGHPLDKFIGAYGHLLDDLESVLRSDTLGKHRIVNDAMLCQSFDKLPVPSLATNDSSISLIASNGYKRVLDLGCGAANLLVGAANDVEGLQGWGVDVSHDMCEAARKKVEKHGLCHRIQIIEGDVRSIDELLSEEEAKQMDIVFGGSILNEFFHPDDAQAVAFLQKVRKLCPHAVFLNADYYGSLRINNNNNSDEGEEEADEKTNKAKEASSRGENERVGGKETMLHDVLQCISGQGVPPTTREGWESVYHRAGYRVHERYEWPQHSISSFLHLCVPLQSPSD